MDNYIKYYGKLNAAQKKAVDIIDGPLLILAGPGTGKTELLSVRAANILRQKKANPENILILSYTNAAAKAMKERLVKILGPAGYDIETSTFHSFANSIILDSEEAANYVQQRVQMAADTNEDIERVKLLEYILDNTDGIDPIRPFKAPYHYRYEIQQKISELKKDGITPKEFEDYAKKVKPDDIYADEKQVEKIRALSVVYKLYEEYKNGKNAEIFDSRGRYDMDDMIILALEVVRKEQGLTKALRQQYTYIMVDEFQDTNGAQLSLLFELVDAKKPNLCCVGDDDQSIFRFQGASVGNFRLFKEKFKAVESVTLEDNYRSTKEIIELSAGIIKHLPDTERVAVKELIPRKDYTKKTIEFHEFTAEAEEMLFIADKVKELKDEIESSKELEPDEKAVPYNNIAILVRKRRDILKLINAFLNAGIPYATDGKEDIACEKRVRQMLDVLALAHLRNISDFAAKDAVLYKVIASDYISASMNDILKFILHVNSLKAARRDNAGSRPAVSLYAEFLSAFDPGDLKDPPAMKLAVSAAISKELKLESPLELFKACRAIRRLISDAETRSVHDILMQYIDDAGVYKYILKEYRDDQVLRVRDLRALSSFVNMVKESDLRNPGLRLSDFIDEIKTKEDHNIPLTGSLVTETQEGVRILTAHGSKGLEFHTVIIPFCLQKKNWPAMPPADKIPIPPDIFKTKEKVADKSLIRELGYYDETRLFYVASTRARSHLLYTASPTESAVSSSYLSSIGLVSAEADSQVHEEDLLAASLSKTMLKDPFIGTEKVLRDMVARLTLNPTSLNNYINCKRKFLYDNVLMLPGAKRLPLVFGNSVHKALEDTYRYLMREKKFPDFKFFIASFSDELDYQGVESGVAKRCLAQAQTLKKWFDNEACSPVIPLGLEKKLWVMIDDNLVFSGKYDKTELCTPEKKLVRVVDYKTGKPDDHIRHIGSGTWDLSSSECDNYLRQLVAYKLLFDRDKDKNKGFKVSEGKLVFIEPARSSVIKYGMKEGEHINKTVQITEDMVAQLERVIKDCWRSIQRLDFEKLEQRDNDTEKCGGCDYENICWQD